MPPTPPVWQRSRNTITKPGSRASRPVREATAIERRLHRVRGAARQTRRRDRHHEMTARPPWSRPPAAARKLRPASRPLSVDQRLRQRPNSRNCAAARQHQPSARPRRSTNSAFTIRVQTVGGVPLPARTTNISGYQLTPAAGPGQSRHAERSRQACRRARPRAPWRSPKRRRRRSSRIPAVNTSVPDWNAPSDQPDSRVMGPANAQHERGQRRDRTSRPRPAANSVAPMSAELGVHRARC